MFWRPRGEQSPCLHDILHLPDLLPFSDSFNNTLSHVMLQPLHESGGINPIFADETLQVVYIIYPRSVGSRFPVSWSGTLSRTPYYSGVEFRMLSLKISGCFI